MLFEKFTANQDYKDRLFKYIFGNPEKIEWALSLYNAVLDDDHTNVDNVNQQILDSAVYIGVHDDAALIVDNLTSFYDQRSTYNPNMPMRFLFHSQKVYGWYLKVYDSEFNFEPIPAPPIKCACFYNVAPEREDKVYSRLSDAFGGPSPIEVKVAMLNLTPGRNKELLDRCQPLKDYATLVENIRVQFKSALSDAFKAALNDMPDDSVVKPFFLENYAEAERVCLREFKETRDLIDMRNEGIEIGAREGKLALLKSLVEDGVLSAVDAAKRVDMTVSEFEEKTGLKS